MLYYPYGEFRGRRMLKYHTQQKKIEDKLSPHVDFDLGSLPQENGLLQLRNRINMSNTNECKKIRQKSQPTTGF